MSSKVPFLRSEVSWVAILFKIVFFLFLCIGFYYFDKSAFYVEAMLVYILVSYSLKMLVPSAHRTGINLLKQEKFEEAIPYFQKCAEYFKKHAWMDKYRAIILFISSKRTFREISLCNAAYCMSRCKKIDEALRAYQAVIDEYPENIVAISALKTINDIRYS